MPSRFRFRVWDKTKKEMVEDVGIFEDSAVIWWKGEDALTEDIGTDVEIMQDTGLKDKNGKVIWEGDILHCEAAKKEARSIVFWSEDWARFRARIIGRKEGAVDAYATLRNWKQQKVEVIGNVWEHPLLLTR